MNARELAAHMAANAATVAEYLLPQGRRAGKEWKAGDTAGAPGASLSVCLSGAKAGVWKDFSSDEGGDLLDLWCARRGVSIADAMRDAKSFLGVRDDIPQRPMPSYKRPSKPQCKDAPPESRLTAWLTTRRITRETIEAFKIREQVRGEKVYAVLPYLRDGELINVKYRNVDDKKDMRQEGGAEPCLFGWHLIDPSARSVAIAEGELDAMTLHQMGIPALSVNAGAGNHQWLDSDWDRLERFSEIYLCYDDDEAGQKGAKEVANRLGLDRCKFVRFPDAKDANAFLDDGAEQADFQRAFANARTLDPEELRSMSEFWNDVKALFYPPHNLIGNPFLSFCGQKQFWFEFRPGEVTVWTGYNGHGKSLLLNQVLIGVMDQGERVCVFSGEMTPARQGKRMAKQLGGLDRPSLPYLDAMSEWLLDRMWLFALVGSASIDRLITVFTYGYKRYGIRHFVIDSLMMTDVQADGPGSMTSQKDVMRKLAGFARQNGVHVHLVAHPRKSVDEKRTPGKQDVSGSGIITDAADNVFAVWSAQKTEIDPSDEMPDAFLELHKNRNGETQHRKLALFFNRDAQQFSTDNRRRPYTHVDFRIKSLEQPA
ncbi:toprim domain-containing protein [Robbsia andropogonis]|uniref:toprim domain-containing protein n=1 Tax=Robbsia andropogonis TaxID=28092 RepID=UPI003D21F528